MDTKELLTDIKYIYKLSFSNISFISKYEEDLDILTNEDMVSILSLSRNNFNDNIDSISEESKINTKNIYLKKTKEENNLLIEKLTNYFYIGKMFEVLEERIKYRSAIANFKDTFIKSFNKKKELELEELSKEELLSNIDILDKKIALLSEIMINEGVQ